MAQEYEQPVDSMASPRTQRMTAAESRAVIALWQQEQVEQTGLTDRPAVPDVAEGLDITVEDVHRLLSEVRARRLEEERAHTAEQVVTEIRQAETNRQLAEIERQRAELQRERAEAERQQLLERWATLSQAVRQPTGPSEFVLGFLPGFVAISIVIAMALLLTAFVHPSLPPIR